MFETSDINVRLSHPHGDIEIPLEEWIKTGPGERDLLQPVLAIRASTGEKLPLSVIPLQYRNTILSRLLISLHILPQPWKPKDNGTDR